MDTKVAIIDNSIDPLLYDPVTHWASFLDVEWRAFRAIEGDFPDLKQDYTHLILTGSEASILERTLWLEREVELIQAAVEIGLSVFGSCYGHQMVALALAGPKHIRRCASHEIGWFPIEITEENALLGEKRTVFSFSSHFDEVFNLEKNFTVFCESKKCKIQGFQWKNRPVWGLQFHPEITNSEAVKYIRNSAAKGGERASFFKDALNLVPKDSGVIYQLISNFIG